MESTFDKNLEKPANKHKLKAAVYSVQNLIQIDF